MPDLMMDVLEWIKDKPDIAEVLYENKNANPPILVHVAMAGLAQKGAPLNGKKIFYVKAPTIGKVDYVETKVEPGAIVAQAQVLGFIQGEKEKVEIFSPYNGRLKDILVPQGQAVGFGEPLLLMEQN